ncbi:MAG TPA: substrate-binding domain-containing protein [Solirubrobacteraceae bacterium]|jgi:ribose transport system substrate-binding protein|nr:substrate-binding domain-containing protein [Solirubrobacteraceae bacterium]
MFRRAKHVPRWPAPVMVLAAMAALAVAVGGNASAATKSPRSATAASSVSYSALLKSLLQPTPTKFAGPTTPAKARHGVKIAAISSAQTLEGDANVASAIATAAKAAGWQERTFDGQGSTSTQNTVIANAVTWGAKVIVLVAVNPVTVQTGLAAAKKAGVIIVGADGATGGFSPNPVIKPPKGDVWPATEVSVNNGAIGKAMGNWIIADSHGSAHTMILGDKEFSGSVTGPQGMESVLKKCKGCTTSSIINFVAADIGTTLGPQVVSYVRSNPNTNYVSVPYDPAVQAVYTALQNAGLASKVKIISNLGDSQNLNYIKSGAGQSADFAWDATYIGWATVDQSIRLMDHMKVFSPNGENVPYVVLTKANLGNSASKKAGWVAPFNYQRAFTKLWK